VKFRRISHERYFVLWANSEEIQEEYSLKELLALLPIDFHERAFRYRKKEDAFNYVLGRLMLKEALDFFNLPKGRIKKLTFTSTGQPLIDGFHFNISHSGTYVVCAIAKEEAIGIDIEVIRPIDIEHLRKPFTEKEWSLIMNASDASRQLLDLWTKKEAVLKLYGAGIGAVDKVDLESETQAIFDRESVCTLKTIVFDERIFMSIALAKK